MAFRSLARRVAARRGQLARPVRLDGFEAARARVAELAAGEGTVVAGPWLAEVGYELLYWIPFLRWAVETEPALRRRLVAVSRGGVHSWYEGLADTYVELYERFEPERLESIRERGSAAAGGLRKQMAPASTDAEVLAALPLGEGYELLHPSVMFGAFRQWLKRPNAKPETLPFRFAPLSPPRGAPALPDDFTAVRFYYRASFPDNAANRDVVARVLDRLTSRGPVVSLDPGRRYDDHVDATPPGDVMHLDELADPASNLAVQTAVVARARAFVGTYGGLAYLGPLVGTPSVSLYSERRFRLHHLELARRLFAERQYGCFVALDTSEIPLLDLVLPRVG